jgi:hypothetical protein
VYEFFDEDSGEFIPLSQYDTTQLTHGELYKDSLRNIARLHDISPGKLTKSQLTRKMLIPCRCKHCAGITVDGEIIKEHQILSMKAYPVPKPRTPRLQLNGEQGKQHSEVGGRFELVLERSTYQASLLVLIVDDDKCFKIALKRLTK